MPPKKKEPRVIKETTLQYVHILSSVNSSLDILNAMLEGGWSVNQMCPMGEWDVAVHLTRLPIEYRGEPTTQRESAGLSDKS